jgi:hypothetical protein
MDFGAENPKRSSSDREYEPVAATRSDLTRKIMSSYTPAESMECVSDSEQGQLSLRTEEYSPPRENMSGYVSSGQGVPGSARWLRERNEVSDAFPCVYESCSKWVQQLF